MTEGSCPRNRSESSRPPGTPKKIASARTHVRRQGPSGARSPGADIILELEVDEGTIFGRHGANGNQHDGQQDGSQPPGYPAGSLLERCVA